MLIKQHNTQDHILVIYLFFYFFYVYVSFCGHLTDSAAGGHTVTIGTAGWVFMFPHWVILYQNW